MATLIMEAQLDAGAASLPHTMARLGGPAVTEVKPDMAGVEVRP